MKLITKIHGKNYDLTNFKHPGGVIPIYLADRKDATVLYELYHPVSNRKMIDKILENYQINEKTNIIEDNSFDYQITKNDLFVDEVKNEVKKYFTNIAKKYNCSLISATKFSYQKIFENISVIFLLWFNIYLYNQDYLFTLFTIPILYLIFVLNNWHDAAHFALTSNKTLELISVPLYNFLWSGKNWYENHNYFHHCYTNILNKDYDLEDELPTKENKKKVGKSKISIVIEIIRNIFYHNMYHPRLKMKFFTVFVMQDIIFITLRFVLLYNFFYKFSFWKVIHFIFMLFVMLVYFLLVTKVNHHHNSCYVKNQNLYRHLIITAYNILPESHLMRILTGGLNCQIEHHIFPSVNSCHLTSLSKIVKRLCKKYNIKYNESNNFIHTVYDTYKTLQKIKSGDIIME